jgi:hypothetical protein
MNEPHIIAMAPTPPILPAAAPSGAALRAELAALLGADLLRRFTSVGPRGRTLIPLVAELAASVAHLTKMWHPGCDPRVPPLLLGGIERLVKGLCLLGTDRVAGTFAERILRDALAIESAVLASMPAVGSA